MKAGEYAREIICPKCNMIAGLDWPTKRWFCRNGHSTELDYGGGVVPVPPADEAVKNDENKVMYHLVPPFAVHQMAEVFTYGASKYGEDNWKSGGPEFTNRLYSACCRHMFQWRMYNKVDPETGLFHLAHAMACLAMIIELEQDTAHGLQIEL